MGKIITYPHPQGIVEKNDFLVEISTNHKDWEKLFVHEVKVDMHNVRKASMVTFDMEGIVYLRVTYNKEKIKTVNIRPLSYQIAFTTKENQVTFELHEPMKLSLEINDERFQNLHIFANEMESEIPDMHADNVIVLEPGSYSPETLVEKINQHDIIYFQPGFHEFMDDLFLIPSNKHVYLEGGSVIVGSFVCKNVKNVKINGRGIMYMTNMIKETYRRGVQIEYSQGISISGITVIDPPHYSILIGQSTDIHIRNFKSFSTRGWSDGIDMMAGKNIHIEDVFMRNSDDCIAVYATRGEYKGDTENVSVKNSILWADVAHPINVGTHGDAEGKGNTIQDLYFSNIDILEHHEPQENYWGTMSLNAGDKNTIKNVKFHDIRVEDFELGQLFDIRVFFNKRYNPAPGERIENIEFKNISYNGRNEQASRIYGYDETRIVNNITFINLIINGEPITSIREDIVHINEHAYGIHFKSE